MGPPGTCPGTFRLFVYGTLKRGGARHRPLAAQRFLGLGHTTSRYALLDVGEYPGLVHCSEEGMVVHGELYEVEDGLRAYLDAVEGSPDWFRLEAIELDGWEGDNWAYFYQGDPGSTPRIASGAWTNP